jgi:hypothetical protein
MFWWLSRRGLHPLACLVGATMLMFGSTTTLKIYAGHISVLSALSWAPFLLVVVDALCDEKRKAPWALLGAFFVAMQIAASFPQHVFYTAAIGGLYFLARLVTAREYSVSERASSFAAFCLMYFGGALLMAVQLLTSWQASKETARSSALSFKFVAMCSFPPENFLTLLVPFLFGDDHKVAYWGRWYLWEVVFFLGISGIWLALWGMWGRVSPEEKRGRATRWIFIGATAILVILALGKYTPLLRFLYEHVPVFGSFRSSARALFQASIFICALAALGLNSLLRTPLTNEAPRGTLKRHALGAILGGVFLTLVGLWADSAGALPVWRRVIELIARSKDYFIDSAAYGDPRLLAAAPPLAAQAFLISGVLCAGVGVLFWLSARSRRATYLLGIAAMLEVCWYAFSVMPTVELAKAGQPEIERFLKDHPGDYRFIKKDLNNLTLSWRAYDMGGYESFRLKRYDEFAQWSQGKDPNRFYPVVYLEKPRPFYRMLRCRYAFDANNKPQRIAGDLPHALLVHNYRILKNRDEIFKTIADPKFDPAREVILESAPLNVPSNKQNVATQSFARVKVLDTDTLEIEAQTTAPAILLITDSYSVGWKATALPGSVQQEYSIQPANYVLRAIPLKAGTHHIRLEYLPSAFVIGKWISIAAWLVFGVLCALVLVRRRALTHAAVSQ